MPTNLFSIPAQRQDFLTSRNAAWVDGFPLIGTPGSGGVVPGTANVGNGGLAVKSIDSSSDYGVHVATISAISNGLTYVTMANPEGDITGRGITGLPFYAGGLTTEVDPGSKPFSVNDTFGVSVSPVPLDLTGIKFYLAAYRAPSASSIWLSGDTDGGQLISGGAGGTLSTMFGKSIMRNLDPGEYPYNVIALDPSLPDSPVVVFFGTISHDVLIRASS